MELQVPFNITSGRYYRHLVEAYMSRAWWLYALPLIAIIVAGVILSDVRFMFLLLIYAFIVVPMAFTFALINYGLHPISRYSILLKRATVNADSIEFHFVDDDGNVKSSAKVAWNDVLRTKATSEELLLLLTESGCRFIVIPYSAFSSPEQLKDFLSFKNVLI